MMIEKQAAEVKAYKEAVDKIGLEKSILQLKINKIYQLVA
jgi:hypothetical protein